MGRCEELLEVIGGPVRLVMVTADANAKFRSRCYSGITSRILRKKTVEVAVFDEVHAYEVDQVIACLSSNSVQTVIFAGDRNRSICMHAIC